MIYFLWEEKEGGRKRRREGERGGREEGEEGGRKEKRKEEGGRQGVKSA